MAISQTTIRDCAFAVTGLHVWNSHCHFITDCTSSGIFRK